MKRVGGISGWVFQGSGEPQLIQTLVKRVLTELSNTPVIVAPYVVGLDSRLGELWRLLDVNSKGIQVLGLHGMGGVGKTTLAKALYNKLVGHFAHRSFITDVRETSAKQNGLVTLQNMLIAHLCPREKPVVDERDGKIAIKRILSGKRVLVVLDDVDDVSQLNGLAARRGWFHEGSLIIVSTRDRELLLLDLVSEIYNVKELDSSDSLKLFSYHALRREKPTEAFLNLSNQIVLLTGGLPLALEVFGSLLFDKRKMKEWEDALQKLKQIRPCHLQDVLKISFDGLDEQEKCIFLDIACLLLNLKMKRDGAIDIMKGCGFRAESAIAVLKARSLIKITEDNTLWMHDQIRDMGRQLILQENLVDPGMRSRLWNHGEIQSVLQDGKGTRNIQGITLDIEKKHQKSRSAKTIAWYKLQSTPTVASALTYLKEMYRDYFEHNEGEIILFTKSFEVMVNLRLLQLSNVRLEGTFKHLPTELKWLQWRKCPLKYLPFGCPRELTVLDLSESNIEKVWGFQWWCWYNRKEVAKKLMVLNLHSCHKLTAIPDLSRHPALEKLILEGCIGLSRIHKSIGDMSTLLHLNMRRCSNLVEFPSDVSGLKCLKTLTLSDCLKLKELPQDMGNMISLVELLLDRTAIEKLPESIFRLTKLEILSLNDCQSLKRLPFCIGKLGSLRELSLNGCPLEEIPDSINGLGNLEELSLMHCRLLTVIPNSVGNLKSLTKIWLNGSSIIEMPASIGSLLYLKVLSVGNCRKISTLPVSIERLASIVELDLDGTSIINLPDQIGFLKSLQKLEMRNCTSLRWLPETIGNLLSLNTLIIVNAAIQELPETIGLLENLVMLRLNNCKRLCSLPASIGNLKSLHHLYMEKTAVSGLPESFGMLSSLMILKMGKERWSQVPQNAEVTTDAECPIVKEKPKLVVLPSTFSNLSMLEEFDACAWKITGEIADDFERLSSLKILDLGHNDFCRLPSSLRGLSFLEKLDLPHCKELQVLPPLPSSLVKLNAANCVALEIISDLSNLEHLEELHLSNCEKLVDIPGFECLKSLIRLNMCGCRSCSPAMKEKLNKVALKNLNHLSIPGSEIPHWLTQEVVRFSKRKNYVLKGIIIGIVVSINLQIPNDLRDQLPILYGIHAKIVRLGMQVFDTTMNLLGVPKTDEDQVYLCRYGHHYNPLVSILEDGDVVEVSMPDMPQVKGVELKKSGIHFIFENDDDYEGDEELLDETQLSVSEKLTKFIKFSERDGIITDSSHKVAQERKDPTSLFYFSLLLMASFFVLLSCGLFVSKFVS